MRHFLRSARLTLVPPAGAQWRRNAAAVVFVAAPIAAAATLAAVLATAALATAALAAVVLAAA